jgi:DNA-binding GntR family transcriptional regulator
VISVAYHLAAVTFSCADHAEIVEAIAGADAGRAAQLVKAHWASGIDVVLRWMKEQA